MNTFYKKKEKIMNLSLNDYLILYKKMKSKLYNITNINKNGKNNEYIT